jgi:hypothetical protein
VRNAWWASVLLPVLLALPLPAQAKKTKAVKPRPVATPAPDAAPAQGGAGTVAFGVGYPDLRLRVGLASRVDSEFKFAFSQSLQIYSARLILKLADVGPLNATAGLEGGWARFDGLDQVSGDGTVAAAFVGLEYPFAQRLRLSVDIGPAWLKASDNNLSYNSTVLVYNTALYFYLF